MNHASGKDYDPSAWARQRQERIKRASQLRHKRRSGSPDKNHTFKPQLQANIDGAVSRLPLGAKVSDAAGPRRGTYDLTKLDGMNAYPATNGINHDRTHGYDDDDDLGYGNENDYRDHGNWSDTRLVGHRDSLDRLTGSASDRHQLSRHEKPDRGHASTGTAPTDAAVPVPPPPPVSDPPTNKNNGSFPNGYRDDGYANGYTGYSDHYRSRQQRESGVADDDEGECDTRRAEHGTDGGDALSHEIDQLPHVRGSISETTPTTLLTPLHHQMSPRCGPLSRNTLKPTRQDRNRSEAYAAVRYNEVESPADTNDQDGFLASLRAGGEQGGGRKQAARRPEWNSDTANLASLRDPQKTHVSDNSPAAVQSRTEIKRRRSRDTDPIQDSPYATPADSHSSNINHVSRQKNSNKVGNTLPCDTYKNTLGKPAQDTTIFRRRSEGGDGGRETKPGGGCRDLNDSSTYGGARRGREGYRLQMMPSSSSGSLTLTRDPGGDDGRDAHDMEGAIADLSTGKDQLRNHLLLLKKKMHSQAGSRRSQSAGPRAGDLHDEDERLDGENSCTDPRRNLNMTTGTAPAMMHASSAAFPARQGELAFGGRRDKGNGRTRPSPEGPGSPYAVDPRNVGPRASSKANFNGHMDVNGHIESTRPLHHQKHLRHGENDRNSEPTRRGQLSPHRSGSTTRKLDQNSAMGTPRNQKNANIATSERGNGVTMASSGASSSKAGSHSSGKMKSAERRRAWSGNSGHRPKTPGNDLNSHRGGSALLGRTGNVGGYAGDLPDEAFPEVELELVQCGQCGRRFKEKALARHANACQTVFQGKRKVFNAAEMRIKGTELEKFVSSSGRGGKASGRGRGRQGRVPANASRRFDETPVGGGGGAKKSSKWRQQSKQFREAIREARVITDAQKSGKSLADLPPPKPSAPDPSFISCPHCGRRFNEVAGERHVLHCKNIKAKPSALKKGSGSLLGHAARATTGNSSSRSCGQRW